MSSVTVIFQSSTGKLSVYDNIVIKNLKWRKDG